jgi:hypothetical protein
MLFANGICDEIQIDCILMGLSEYKIENNMGD